MKKFSLLLIIIFILTSCPKQIDLDWYTFGGNFNRTNSKEIGPKPPLKLKYKFKTEGRILYPPLIINENIIFGSRDGYIYSLSLNGDLLWKYNMGNGGFYHSLTLYNNILFTGTWVPPYYIKGLDLNGKLVMELKTNGEVQDLSPVVAIKDGILYYNTDEMDIKNSSPFLFPPTIISLVAFDLNKQEIIWKIPLKGKLNSPPTLFNGNIFLITSNENILYSLDTKTGYTKWIYSIDNESFCTPLIANEHIFINDNGGNIYCFNLDGKLIWKYKIDSEILSSLAFSNDTLFITANNGYIYAFDTKNLEILWKFKTLKSIVASPVVSNGYVYIGSYDTYFYIFDYKTGKVLWRYKTDGEIESSCSIRDKIIALGSQDGYLYVFEEKK